MAVPIKLVWALALSAGSPAWAMHECVTADGKVSYQEQPFATGERSAAIAPPPTRAELDRRSAESAPREWLAREIVTKSDIDDH